MLLKSYKAVTIHYFIHYFLIPCDIVLCLLICNYYVTQSEASLLIRPLIKDMTKSELHAIMTGGFATIAGSVMAAYILFGVSFTPHC